MRLFHSLIFFFLLSSLAAQNDITDITTKLDTYLDTELQKFRIPNVELLVIQGDAVIYRKSKGIDSNPQTPYYIGSASKSLTAFALLKLVDSGHLNLDQKVTDILPNLSFSQFANEVTVRSLLNQTSGIGKKDGFRNLPTLEELKAKPFKIHIGFKPGSQHEYSNLNYALLGLIIESASGLSFEDFMRQEVFEPLEMNDTYAASRNIAKDIVIDQYQYWFGVPIKSRQVNYRSTSIPAGFICSSSEDMGHYIRVNLNNGRFNGHQILSDSLLATMHTPWNQEMFNYAMGWKQGSINDKMFLQHLGSTATSYSGLFIIPEENLGFVLLTNSNSMSFSEGLLLGVLQILTGSEPDEVSKQELYMRIGIGVLLFLIVTFFFNKMVRIFKQPSAFTLPTVAQRLFMNCVLLIAFVLVFPRVASLPFKTFMKIQPDIGWMLLFAFTLPLLLNLTRVLLSWKNRNSMTS